MKDETLDKALSIRVSDEEFQRLDALVERVRVLSRHALAREALRLGLVMLEADPSRLFASASPKPKKVTRRR